MELLTFEDLQAQIQDLYQNGEYAAALDLATRQFERFPEHQILLYYWRITMSARLGDKQEALSILQEVLEAGNWYGEVLLRKSPSLETLQGSPDFERLVELNQYLQESQVEQRFPMFTLRAEGRCQSGDKPCPLLLGLHANASNAQGSMGFWRPAATAGWLVGAPQSSQALWNGTYVWEDRQTSEREIKRHYKNLTEQYAVDLDRTILAGHSLGGEIATWLALKGAIPTCGFIAIGPGGPFMEDLEKWKPAIQESLSRDLRGYFIMGGRDKTIPQETVRALVETLVNSGLPCELHEIPHAGHDFIPEYEAAILNALEFIVGD